MTHSGQNDPSGANRATPAGSTTGEGGAPQVIEVCTHRVTEAVSEKELRVHGITPETLAQRVADVVSRNLSSGRAQRAMPALEPSRDDSREAYVDRVITTYLREHQQVEALAAGDDAAWNDLYEQLAGHAYHVLLRRQIPAARAANEAPGFAQQACAIIFNQPFPYDVPFDAWSGRILINCILKRYTRSSNPLDQKPRPVPLDQPVHSETGAEFSLHELLGDDSSEDAFEKVEVREWLLGAIAGLPSAAQQEVIIYGFLYEWSDDEIAGELGKTKQAIYNLRHRALQGLKQLLNAEGMKE